MEQEANCNSPGLNEPIELKNTFAELVTYLTQKYLFQIINQISHFHAGITKRVGRSLQTAEMGRTNIYSEGSNTVSIAGYKSLIILYFL